MKMLLQTPDVKQPHCGVLYSYDDIQHAEWKQAAILANNIECIEVQNIQWNHVITDIC